MEEEKKLDVAEMTFYERLVKTQIEVKAPKSQYNSFGKYHYRSADDIYQAAKPINEKYGLYLTLTDELFEIGGRVYIKAIAKIVDCFNPSNSIYVTAYAREAEIKKGMDDSQITGGASSYARKYALNGLYLLDDTKDADTEEFKQQVDSAKAKIIDETKAKALKQKVENLAKFISEKTGDEQPFDKIYSYLSDHKFMKVIPIEKLDTEQYVTINRFADELKKRYEKQK